MKTISLSKIKKEIRYYHLFFCPYCDGMNELSYCITYEETIFCEHCNKEIEITD